MLPLTIYLITSVADAEKTPETIQHYQNNFPEAHIIVLCEGNIQSVIHTAILQGCSLINWGPATLQMKRDLKNNMWKTKISPGWTMYVENGFLLQATSQDIQNEEEQNITLLTIDKPLQVACFRQDLIKEIKFPLEDGKLIALGKINWSSKNYTT